MSDVNNAVATENDPLAALGIKRTFAYVDKNGKGYTEEEVTALRQAKEIKGKIAKITGDNAELAQWVFENRTAILEALHVDVKKAKKASTRVYTEEQKAKMREAMQGRMAEMQAKRKAALEAKKAAKAA